MSKSVSYTTKELKIIIKKIIIENINNDKNHDLSWTSTNLSLSAISFWAGSSGRTKSLYSISETLWYLQQR